jgi:hypothetical protein
MKQTLIQMQPMNENFMQNSNNTLTDSSQNQAVQLAILSIENSIVSSLIKEDPKAKQPSKEVVAMMARAITAKAMRLKREKEAAQR